MELSASDVRASTQVIQNAAVVVGQLEVPDDALIEAFQCARKGGAVTVLNAAPARDLPPGTFGRLAWLVVNECEAVELSGMSVNDLTQAMSAAAALRQLHDAEHVVITLGPEGAVLAELGGVRHFPVSAVEALDTTGAGDTFVGALAASLAKGMTSEHAVRRAQAASAWAVARRGVRSSMPRQSDLVD